MMIVAFLCFIALVAAWFIAPKEGAHTERAPLAVKAEVALSAS